MNGRIRTCDKSGESNPVAKSDSHDAKLRGRHTLWNILAHRGEDKHPPFVLQVYFTVYETRYHGKKAARCQIPQLFWLLSLSFMSLIKSSGSVTFKNGPNERTRIRSSVSSFTL